MATKADKNRQIDLRTLNPQQAAAVDLVVAGQRDAEIAEAVGVTRQTVNAWRHWHPEFQAAVNRQRADLWGEAADRLRTMLPKALDSLEQMLDAPPDMSASTALAVVKLAGLTGDGLRPAGPLDADGVILAAARRPIDQVIEALDQPDTDAAQRMMIERLAVANGLT